VTIATLSNWKAGSDLPYVLQAGEQILTIVLPARWLKAARDGRPLLLPPAVRALDRLRALLLERPQFTPGFIASLREALSLTQEEFGQKLGVSKMTVSRWECGRMRPGAAMAKQLQRLQRQARRNGVLIKAP
jgi:DNA-binding transcriptional regulator YiaG